MTYWGPGAIPPGYMLAPDGTLVAIPPGMAPHAGYPMGPMAHAPVHPPYAAPTYPQQAMVSVTITTGAPQHAMHPMQPGYPMQPAYPMQPGYPMQPSPQALLPPLPVAVHTMGHSPANMHALSAGTPAAYAPSWSGHPSPGDSALAPVSGDILALREHTLQTAGAPGSSLPLATSALIMASALLTVTLFAVPVGAVLASAAVASGVTGGVGLWLMRKRKKSTRGRVELAPELQVKILDFAARNRGRVTVTSLAQGLGLTLDEADLALHAMAGSNYVDVELDPSSTVIVYVFRELVSKPAQLPARTTPEGAPSTP
ncbi:MAG: hypothetical protein Q8Q09_27315 [Deltaproteobacteria bacterium]|nr:hypothetical protein [Deltaproteobacteria bacterium]